jgi:ribosomal protein S1
MSEELKKEEVLTQTENQEELQAAAEPSESMADYAGELEESYKAFDERRNQTYVPEESPDAEKWQELRQMQADKTVVKVKIKEIVKGGAVTYLNTVSYTHLTLPTTIGV